ncbi:MAG: UDP-N-acetylmuramoyl-L-alanyl-D-glutamate--2,6-diaminopimelate ligase [Clostridia bacterium]|nr:UDP-N-acetylmuramoyl-L-alanyl-D-glutamate--2,6-diaminopimelate ligase [Clostridia bacterium]
MKLSQIMQDVDIVRQSCDFNMEISDICYDSRQAVKDCAFLAIRGFRTDGHLFIAEAARRGAAVVIAERTPEENVPYVLVRDSRRAMAQMAKNFFGRPDEELKLIGVTGTNGKTTVTYLIKHILESNGKKCGLIGTNDIYVGDRVLPAQRTTPESCELYKLLREMRDAGCGHVVMEVSSHALTLDRVYGLTFETAVFTNLSRDHLDFHEDMEHYLQAKAKLFEVCRSAVVNYDDPAGHKVIENKKCYKMTYSAKENSADLVAKNIQLKASKVEFEAVTTGEINHVALGIPGMFSVYNALAAIGCGMSLGISLSDAAICLRTCRGVKGRAEVVPTDTDYTVIIDYAHTPDGINSILKAVRGFAKGRVVALFGCGGDRDKTKRPLMGKAAADNADVCIVTSDNPRSEDPKAIIDDILPGVRDSKAQLHVIEDRREAIAFALKNARPNDVIVLMGKGHETYQEIKGKKLHMDEREIVAELLK